MVDQKRVQPAQGANCAGGEGKPGIADLLQCPGHPFARLADQMMAGHPDVLKLEGRMMAAVQGAEGAC